MTWVKLCGMRTAADVAAAVAAGADAIGFVIAPGSSRCIDPEEAAAAGSGAPVDRFLVSVDLEPDRLLSSAVMADVTGVQPHGAWSTEATAAALEAGFSVLFPIPVGDRADLSMVPPGAVPILDTAVPGRHGGTGTGFAWEAAAGLDRPFVLAGGLTPVNVAAAIAATGAWGVDVSSGIEGPSGQKDSELMTRFVEAVR